MIAMRHFPAFVVDAKDVDSLAELFALQYDILENLGNEKMNLR
jgi:hypothetical protein